MILLRRYEQARGPRAYGCGWGSIARVVGSQVRSRTTVSTVRHGKCLYLRRRLDAPRAVPALRTTLTEGGLGDKEVNESAGIHNA